MYCPIGMYAYIHVCIYSVCCVCLSRPSGREPGRQTDCIENRTDRKENIYILSLITWHGKPNATIVVVRLQYYCSTVVYVVYCTLTLVPLPLYPYPYPYALCLCVMYVLCCCVVVVLTRRVAGGGDRKAEAQKAKAGARPKGAREEKRKEKIFFFIFFLSLCVVCGSSVAHISLRLGGFGGFDEGQERAHFSVVKCFGLTC